jgi:hypothetical protein
MLIRLFHHRLHLGHQGGPVLTDLVPHLGEFLVPHVEGERHVVGQTPTGLSQQRVALFDDAVQFESSRVVFHGQRREGFVHESSSFARAPLHQLQIVGREHRDAQYPEQITGAGQALSIHLHVHATLPLYLHFDQHVAPVGVSHRGANGGELGALANESRGGTLTKTVEGGEEGHGFGHVRLALRVASDDGGHARRQVERGRCVVAEVDELKLLDDHHDFSGINRYVKFG